MIQFTEEEIRALRKKAAETEWAGAVEAWKQAAEGLLHSPLRVPETGIGNWTLYYYCPDCSVPLVFEKDSPQDHRCPVCGRILRGEPYDGAWWGFMHMENYNGAFQLAILYLLTGERSYGRKAVEILKEYATYYEGYEVHGDIPYNGPGKACAQTLDEAVLIRTFTMTCDLIGELMDGQERERIEKHLLLPGAEFLLQHRHRQLHNHEVIINSAIAVTGLLLGEESFVRQAVYGEYGLTRQLEKGMLPEGLWFEGSFGYHFYALTSFFAYEKFAIHTAHSHISHPNYRKMMEVLVHYIQPDGQIPMLNDTTYGHNVSSLYLYEFAYREWKSPAMLAILNLLYADQKRDNLEALLYGAEKLESCEPGPGGTEPACFHTTVGESGHTVLRGDDGRFLLFKHDTYGGEHDHYDRLGISYLACGRRIAADLGTTGYGAVLHYDYYKNTGSHNTVTIGEENQPPAACRLDRYETVDGITCVEASCDWAAPYVMPDSFTIVQWKEENYRNVKMTRKLAWAGTWFAELFVVEGVAEGLTVDWVMHFSGSRQGGTDEEPQPGTFSEKKPFCHLSDVVRKRRTGQVAEQMTEHYTDGEIHTDLYSYVSGGEVYAAKGPDNPSYRQLNYRIERKHSSDSACRYLHVTETYREEKTIESVTFMAAELPGQSTWIEVRDRRGVHRIEF